MPHIYKKNASPLYADRLLLYGTCPEALVYLFGFSGGVYSRKTRIDALDAAHQLLMIFASGSNTSFSPLMTT
jgi:hypothetical protein